MVTVISPEDGPVRIDVLQRLAEQAMSDPTFRDEARDDLPATPRANMATTSRHRNSRWSFAFAARLPTRESISTLWTARATSGWPTSSIACNAAPGARAGPDIARSRLMHGRRTGAPSQASHGSVDRIDSAPGATGRTGGVLEGGKRGARILYGRVGGRTAFRTALRRASGRSRAIRWTSVANRGVADARCRASGGAEGG